MKVKAPKEDPTIKGAREREERRADAAVIENTSNLLDDETRRKIRKYGKRAGRATTATGGGSGGSGGGGTGPTVPTTGGGTGSGFGGACPAPWVAIALADGSDVMAGDLTVGMLVRTYHEHSIQQGDYAVEAVSREESQRWLLSLEDGRTVEASFDHRVRTEAGWVEMRNLSPGDTIFGSDPGVVESIRETDIGPVMRITVTDAHTYLTAGLLSHNAKASDSYL